MRRQVGEIRTKFTSWKCFARIPSATTMGVQIALQPGGRFIVKKHNVLSLGLGAVLSFGLFSVGCSSNNSSSVDAGKKDGAAGSGGKGGSSGNGGSTGVGGSGSGGSATGGSSGNGGAIGTGGSASGGNSGTGGSSGTGGAIVGGSTGSGGSATGGSSGTGGSAGVDGGSVDGGGGDALDAPIGGNDAAIDSGSVDTGTVTVVDSGALDEGMDVPSIDTTPVFLDAEIDTTVLDVGTYDGNLDTSANCIQQIVDNGYASGIIPACSSCSDNGTSLQSKCEGTITCLLTSNAGGFCKDDTGNCRTNCLNSVGASGVVATCVANLVSDACK